MRLPNYGRESTGQSPSSFFNHLLHPRVCEREVRHDVIRAESEREAREIMDGDPAVRGGVFRAHLFPYQPMLMGNWEGEEG